MRLSAVALCACLACAVVQAQVAPAPAAAKPTKACETASRKIDREQKAIDLAAESVARDRKARATCTSRVLCSRLDAAIESATRTQARHEARMKRFQQEVVDTCGG